MKKFIIIVISLLLALFTLHTLYFSFGVRLGPRHTGPAAVFARTEGKSILLDRGGGFEPFTVRGVDLGSDIPGKWSADYAVDEETYTRWFGQIQDMGANTIRIYAVHGEAFYRAFYAYNSARAAALEEPLYLLQGVWVNDYAAFSRLDFYDRGLLPAFRRDCLTAVDVIHGRRELLLGRMASSGSGRYHCDVSPWVLGYVLGVEWDRDLVIYTDEMCADRNRYEGRYVSASEEASPFEAALAQAADSIIAYETERYGTQRLVAFSNWPVTDPFQYSVPVTASTRKLAAVDMEHLAASEAFRAGFFASYHVYPYFPDYLALEDRKADFTDEIRYELDNISSNLRLKRRLAELFVPLDITPRSGSNYCEEYRLRFDCGADFLLVLHGEADSRLLVQERYESLRSQYAPQLYGVNTYVAANIPEAASPVFVPIQMMVKLESRLYIPASEKGTPSVVLFETGKLVHGSANPEDPEYNSLADFCRRGDDIEVRLPWQLLNFADPSLMQIHDDYYRHYGVSYMTIDRLRAGVSDGADGRRFASAVLPLSGWGNRVTCHERLKRSYEMVREMWLDGKGAG